MRLRLLTCSILVACGGDDPAPAIDAPVFNPPIDAVEQPIDAPALPSGSAAITGTLAEQTVEPTTAFYVRHPLVQNTHILVMNEGGGTCVTNMRPPGLSALVGFPCGPAEARAYVAKASDAACDPGAPHVWILVEGFSGEFSEYEAATGSATITAIAPTFAGTFTADFGDKGALTGTFDATVCP